MKMKTRTTVPRDQKKKSHAVGIVILAGISSTIPDSTPLLLTKADDATCTLLEQLALKLHQHLPLNPMIIALPENDRPLVKKSGIPARLPKSIKLVFGHSDDVVQRLAWVMTRFHLEHALKIRGKDVLVDTDLNAQLISEHCRRNSDVTFAARCAKGLCGIVLSRKAVELLLAMRLNSVKMSRFADLWNPRLRVTRQAVKLNILPAHDFTLTNTREDSTGAARTLKALNDRFSAAVYEIILPKITERITRKIADFLSKRPALPTVTILAAHVWDDIPQRNHHLARCLAQRFNILFLESASNSVRGMLGASAQTTSSFNSKVELVAENFCREEGQLLLIRSPLFHDFHVNMREPKLRNQAYAFYKSILASIPGSALLVYLPMYWDFIARGLGNLGPIIYDCCDEFRAFGCAWPEIPTLEAALAKRADLIFTSSERLRRRLAHFCRNTVLLPNGVAFENVVSHHDRKRAARLARPVIGFVGGITEWLDQELLYRVANIRPDWQFVLYGPIMTDVDELRKARNIHLLGPLPHVLIPNVLRGFDVCMIPFKINDLTRSVDPVKLYEYLAAGKPVVSTPLPDVVCQNEVVFVGATPKSFCAAIENALRTIGNKHQIVARRTVARSRDWDKLGALMSTTIKSVVYRKSTNITSNFAKNNKEI